MIQTTMETTRLTVRLPNDLLETYDDQAKGENLSLEELITKRLARCVSHTSDRDLHIPSDSRQKLELLLNKNYFSAAVFIQDLKNALSMSIQGTQVTLDPNVLSRLKSRDQEGRGFPKFLQKLVVELLEQYVGLR